MTTTKLVELTPWEQQHLSLKAAANALTYSEHHARGHLRPAEIAEMERWTALAEKLSKRAPQHPFAEFVQQVAVLRRDEETEGGLENDDCFDTVQSLIRRARELVGDPGYEEVE